MMERRFVVQYRMRGTWIDFTDYILEADAKEKAKKMSRFGATRVVTRWYE